MDSWFAADSCPSEFAGRFKSGRIQNNLECEVMNVFKGDTSQIYCYARSFYLHIIHKANAGYCNDIKIVQKPTRL